MNPVRVDLTMSLARGLGIVGPDRLVAVPAPDANDSDLLLVHEQSLIDAVRRSGADPALVQPPFGLGTDDNPTFAGMHEAARHVAGAIIEAARNRSRALAAE